MKKAILILGAGPMQIPAIDEAKKAGFYVAVVDGNPSAPGGVLADEFNPVDLKDLKGLLDYGRKLKSCKNLAGVFTCATDFSASVAYLTENLGLPGHSYESALNATDKSRMRECFKKAGVPSPLFTKVTGKTSLEPLMEKIGFPMVIKPVDNMGARGCSLVRNCNELKQAVDSALKYSRSGTCICESYMDGPEFSVDALVVNEKIYITGFAKRHIYFEPFFVELGHTIPCEVSPAVYRELIDVFEKGIRALGLSWGAAKGDLKYTSKGAMIGEIAGRLSGGYMSGWTYPESSGVNLIKQALKLAVGNTDLELTPGKKLFCAERAWISIPGIVRKVTSPLISFGGIPKVMPDSGLSCEEISNIKAVIPRAKAGDRVVFPRNNVEKCGNVIVTGKNTEECEHLAKKLCSSILISLEPGVKETGDFLCSVIEIRGGKDGGKKAFPPLAFPFGKKEPEIIKALLGLELYKGSFPEKVENKIQSPKIFIAPVPDFFQEYMEKPDFCCWNNLPFSDTINRVMKEHSVSFHDCPGQIDSGCIVLNGYFYRALAAGGLQAVDWVINCIKRGIKPW